MKIQKNVYQDLMKQLCTGAAAREVGGILGGSGGCVTAFFLDCNSLSSHPCCYVPDVEKMNSVIQAWDHNAIQFMGIFHSHHDASSLSPQDRRYIQMILKAAAQAEISTVYFPVISLEKGRMAVYHGDSATFLLQEDTLELTEDEKQPRSDTSHRKT